MASETKSGNFAVALLDILGSRTYDTEVAPRVKERVDFLRDSMERVIDEMKRPISKFGSELPDPQYMAFGDSVLFMWQLDDQTKYLPYVGYAMGEVFVDCLQKGIALRGALSFGHVCYDDQVAVGPAISDAGDWYEEANALAILLTPRTGFLVEMYRPQNPELFDQAFAEFECELKSSENKRQEMWAVAWPSVLRERAKKDGIADNEIRPQLLSTLHQRFMIPKGTETKYEEALRFFDECASQWAEQADARQHGGEE